VYGLKHQKEKTLTGRLEERTSFSRAEIEANEPYRLFASLSCCSSEVVFSPIKVHVGTITMRDLSPG
jgi:hypothetical protein